MRFMIDGDHGDAIRGWVIPDNPLATSRVAVSVDGRRVAEVSATVLVETGDGSGLWRFQVDEDAVPGLSGFACVEIHDVDTNVMIFRRVPNEGLCQRRVILINTGIHPEATLQATLYPHFRQSYFGIGKFTEAVLTVLFDTPSLDSCFMSGSVLMPRYEPHFASHDALTMMLIQDPFVEMAARMLWLRERAELAGDPAQSWRLGDRAEAAMFAAECDFADAKGLKRFFRMLPQPAYQMLYNPLTRLLATRFPDDHIYPPNSIIAVELLSRIGIVGHRDYFEAFATTVLHELGIEAPIPAAQPIPPAVRELGDRLRQMRSVQDFLSYDVVMSEGVRKSFERNWAS